MMPSTAEERTRGWIRLHRRVLDKAWLANPKLWAFWSWCLLKASHRSHTVILGHQTINLQPGQFLFGRKRAAAELCQGEQSIRTHLAFLRDIERSITIRATNKYSIITIVNWHTYQAGGVEDSHQTNQPFTSDSPAGGHKREWSTNERKKRELSVVSEDQLAQFNLFYEAYPRHEGKQAALEVFAKLNPSELGKMILALERQKAIKWQLKGTGQFTPEWPMPARWLSERRWDDDISEAVPQCSTDPIQRAMQKMGLTSIPNNGGQHD